MRLKNIVTAICATIVLGATVARADQMLTNGAGIVGDVKTRSITCIDSALGIAGLAGVSTSTAGGTVAVAGGAGYSTGAGGAVSFTGGASGSGATGNGGAASVTGGAAASTNGTGGAASLIGGVATGTGTGGAVTIRGGASAGASGTAGAVTVDAGAATGGTAAGVTIGSTNANAVTICNTATCDTVSIGTNADADAISVGDSTDTVALTSALWSVTGPGIATFAGVRVTNGSALSTSTPTLTKANIQAASFWSVSTASNAVAVVFSDAAFDSADIGSVKRFAVTTGHATQALTIGNGTGVTVSTHNTLGTTCEDVGDTIECVITGTGTATCITYCAD